MAGRVRGAAVAVLLAAALGACGTVSERRDQVRDAATAFERALRDRAYDRVCALLAPGTREELEQSSGSPCPDAVSGEPLPAGGAVRTTDVYGNQARAVLTTDTLFLSHFDAGWKVVAAGCEPRPERPYQCRLKGG